MHARPASHRHWRRLAVATVAVAVVAAGYSGPALADPGLPPLLPGLSDPVGAVSETGTGTVEGATGVVESAVPGVADDVEQTVNQTVENAGTTLETVTGNGSGAPEPTAPAPAEPSREATGTSPTPSPTTSASEPAQPGPSVTEPEPSYGRPGRLSASARAVPAPTSTYLVDEIRRASGPAGQAGAPPTAGPAVATVSPRTSHDPLSGVTAGISRDNGSAARQPLLRFDAEQPLPGGLLHEWPSPMPVLVALLGLLALVAPRARGPRLRPATPAAHAVDVRFRLVRPG